MQKFDTFSLILQSHDAMMDFYWSYLLHKLWKDMCIKKLYNQIFSISTTPLEVLFMEKIKIFLLCGMKQSLCPIVEKTMSPMGQQHKVQM